MRIQVLSLGAIAFEIAAVSLCESFTPLVKTTPAILDRQKTRTPTLASTSPEDIASEPVSLAVPLNFLGNIGYPSIELQFDHSTLNFILATGSNLDTVHPAVAQQLQLPVVTEFTDVGVVSTGLGGSFRGGQLLRLGDATIAGETCFLDVQAASFDVHTGEGLLGTPFFLAFGEGVEFRWHDDVPALVLHQQGSADLRGMTRVPLGLLSASIMTLPLTLGEMTMDSLLVTCSPITIVSPEAAQRLGLQVSDDFVSGIDGSPLYKSASSVAASVGGVVLGEPRQIFIGTVPAVQFLQTLGPAPEIVLGLDFLRQSRRMLIKLGSREIFFQGF